MLRDLRRDTALFRKHEEAAIAGVNLFVFVFVSTSIELVLQYDRVSGHAGYLDALYLTVTTLTTTGYGDITLATPGGKLLAVLMMRVGVAQLPLRHGRRARQPEPVALVADAHVPGSTRARAIAAPTERRPRSTTLGSRSSVDR